MARGVCVLPCEVNARVLAWTIEHCAPTRVDLTTISKATQLAHWPPSAITSFLRQRHTVQGALNHAAKHGKVAVVEHMVLHAQPPARADHQESVALWHAAKHGQLGVCRLLLSLPEHPSKADDANSAALSAAATRGLADTCQLLLDWPHHPARACDDGSAALHAACAGGHYTIARMLLSQPKNAAKADSRKSAALILAATTGNLPLCQLLLRQPQHAARANHRLSESLAAAARAGAIDVCKLLLSQQHHAALASGNDSAALVLAVQAYHRDLCEVLLTQPQHPATVTTEALYQAIKAPNCSLWHYLLEQLPTEEAAQNLREELLLWMAPRKPHAYCRKLLTTLNYPPIRAACLHNALHAALSHGYMHTADVLMQHCQQAAPTAAAAMLQDPTVSPLAKVLEEAGCANDRPWARDAHAAAALQMLVRAMQQAPALQHSLKEFVLWLFEQVPTLRQQPRAVADVTVREFRSTQTAPLAVEAVLQYLSEQRRFDWGVLQSEVCRSYHTRPLAADLPTALANHSYCDCGGTPECTALVCGARAGHWPLVNALLSKCEHTEQQLSAAMAVAKGHTVRHVLRQHHPQALQPPQPPQQPPHPPPALQAQQPPPPPAEQPPHAPEPAEEGMLPEDVALPDEEMKAEDEPNQIQFQ